MCTLHARSYLRADVVELVDTQASEACGCKAVLVRVQSSAPFRNTGHPINRMPFLFEEHYGETPCNILNLIRKTFPM